MGDERLSEVETRFRNLLLNAGDLVLVRELLMDTVPEMIQARVIYRYDEEIKRRRSLALDELVAQAQELGMGY